jgi:AraC-like DNA-binding protein
MDIKIYKDTKSSLAELRYTKTVQNCEKIHTHDTLTIATIEYGRQEIFINKSKNQITSGILAVINPNEPHYGKTLHADTKDGYVLYIQKIWCMNIQMDLFDNVNRYIPISQNIIEDVVLYDNFIKMCRLLLDNSFTMDKDCILIEFATELLSKYLDLKSHKKINITKDQIYAEKIKNYLDENYLKDISLDRISSLVGLSSFYTLRLFKNIYGIPPHAYLLNKKIHHAKELLMSKLPIVDVAVESGFFDQSHFCRSFKRVFSITPKEYQDNIHTK